MSEYEMYKKQREEIEAKKSTFCTNTEYHDDGVTITVMQRDGYVKGVLSIYDDFPDIGDKIGMISGIHTEERYRKQGWANRMLAYLEEIGKRHKITMFELAVEQSWKVGWYKRHGYSFYAKYEDTNYIGMRKMISK